jgi:hypothetical protein
MRRVSRLTTAPIFNSFNRIVFGLALASGVFPAPCAAALQTGYRLSPTAIVETGSATSGGKKRDPQRDPTAGPLATGVGFLRY